VPPSVPTFACADGGYAFGSTRGVSERTTFTGSHGPTSRLRRGRFRKPEATQLAGNKAHAGVIRGRRWAHALQQAAQAETNAHGGRQAARCRGTFRQSARIGCTSRFAAQAGGHCGQRGGPYQQRLGSAVGGQRTATSEQRTATSEQRTATSRSQ